MSPTVNSFDVFDTLIGRRDVEPHAVLERIEEALEIPGVAAARKAADRRLGMTGRQYGLQEIWAAVARDLGLLLNRVSEFVALEIHIEHEQVIPIVENLALVQDGDVLVSDTYLSAPVVRSLLVAAGFRRQVALIVSNDGKFRGHVWGDIVRRVTVGRHLGDNPHSDGHSPSTAGIPAVIYTGAGRSAVEKLVADHGLVPLANLMREVRLANPFGDAASSERLLWLMACQLNFPLLLLASLLLEKYALERSVRRLLFVSRDCLLWQRLHRVLFPQRESEYFFASRMCQFHPSSGYLRYFRAHCGPDDLIVDLSVSGRSNAAGGGRFKCRHFEGVGVRYLGFLDALGIWECSGGEPTQNGDGRDDYHVAPAGLVEPADCPGIGPGSGHGGPAPAPGRFGVKCRHC